MATMAKHIAAELGQAGTWELGQTPIAMPIPRGNTTKRMRSTSITMVAFLTSRSLPTPLGYGGPALSGSAKGRGFLTGAAKRAEEYPEGDYRRNDPRRGLGLRCLLTTRSSKFTLTLVDFRGLERPCRRLASSLTAPLELWR